MESVQVRYKIYAQCAVIAEPRRLASKPFDQNPAQARPEEPPKAITGSHHGASAIGSTEIAARAPEPWCVIHDPGCSIPGIVCAERGPRATAHGPRGVSA